MKTSFRTAPLIAVLLFLICFAGWKLAHAQDATTSDEAVADTNIDWNSMSDSEVELQAIEQTTPIPASQLPESGTFWSAQHSPVSLEPWPPLPSGFLDVSAWPLGDDVFVLDDLNVNYAAMAQAAARSQKASGIHTMDDSGGGFSPDFNIANFGTNLWLEITNLASNTAALLISNTQPDIEYEIQGKANLTDTQWISEGFVLGSELTNWTPASVTATNYPKLFLRISSWADDGSGLPIWWQLQYFGTTGVDPNADPAGDGWSNIQKFQNGWNPNVFYTPPTPQGLAAVVNAGTNTATVSWQSSFGPVTGYTVTNSDGDTFDFSAGTEDFEDSLSADVPNGYYIGDPTIYKTYQVQAHYTGGNSAWSTPVALESPQSISAWIVKNGSQGVVDLIISALPADTVAIRLEKVDEQATGSYGDDSYNTNWDIPISSFTNGVFSIPASWAPVIDGYGLGDYAWWIQAISANGDVSVGTTVLNSTDFFDSINGVTLFWPAPFFDGRAQLKQNLIFQLRSATTTSPFQFDQAGIGETAYPDSHTYASFDQIDGNNAYMNWVFDKYKPVEDNYLFRNFVFNTSDLDSNGRTTTGMGGNYDEGGLTLSESPAYQFSPPGTFSTTLATVLSTSTTRWLCSYALDSSDIYLYEIGITNEPPDYVMFSNAKDYWGLPFLSAEVSSNGPINTTLSAGGYTTQGGYFYPETAQPQFQTVEYDFWNPNTDWLPGGSGFSTTNKSDLLIVAVGHPIEIAGYAKLAVTNGFSGVYGYLQQYFTNAYAINTNGVVTTNVTGILSPYGLFFPTNPGPVALVTMPDPDTGAQGTCTVYAVSLALDANHDGNMDLSFGGGDATSPNQPFTFWANNNFDRWHTVDVSDSEQDDLEVVYGYNGSRFPVPDCNYTNAAGYRAIPCSRDLEDFSRLWINGVTSNLLAALPSGSTITLNWGDVGSPNPANPTIDLFAAADSDGGIGYQTNETVADEQTNLTDCPYIGRLAPGGSIQLNTIQFANNWAGNHFIWCGVSNGTGGLTMTIADGSGNVLAQTTAYIQIVDIKQMYERCTVGDNPSLPVLNVATNVSDGLPIGASAFQYTPPQNTNTPYILFVHGWNQPLWEKDRFAETAFKRLYWQGFQGRFGEFRWPTYYDFPFGEVSYQAIDTRNFDNSESNAWASAVGLLNKLTDLNSQYPGKVYLIAHSMGNVVAGEALRLAGTNQVVNTYAAMQGAIASHTYDPTTPTRPLTLLGVNYDSGTPNRYAQYPTNGGPSYFNGSAGAGTYVNFFNTNDWALVQLWEPDQDFKPDNGGLSYPGYFYSVSSQHPNGFYYQFGSGTNDFHNLNFPGDTYTIFSFCDEARCHALGAQIGVGGKFAGNQVELDGSPYNFGPVHKYHSGEFRSDNAQRWQFWDEVLVDFELKSP